MPSSSFCRSMMLRRRQGAGQGAGGLCGEEGPRGSKAGRASGGGKGEHAGAPPVRPHGRVRRCWPAGRDRRSCCRCRGTACRAPAPLADKSADVGQLPPHAGHQLLRQLRRQVPGADVAQPVVVLALGEVIHLLAPSILHVHLCRAERRGAAQRGSQLAGNPGNQSSWLATLETTAAGWQPRKPEAESPGNHRLLPPMGGPLLVVDAGLPPEACPERPPRLPTLTPPAPTAPRSPLPTLELMSACPRLTIPIHPLRSV